MYQIEFTPKAVQGALNLKKSEPQAYKKLEKLILELQEHPTTGTGHAGGGESQRVYHLRR